MSEQGISFFKSDLSYFRIELRWDLSRMSHYMYEVLM